MDKQSNDSAPKSLILLTRQNVPLLCEKETRPESSSRAIFVEEKGLFRRRGESHGRSAGGSIRAGEIQHLEQVFDVKRPDAVGVLEFIAFGRVLHGIQGFVGRMQIVCSISEIQVLLRAQNFLQSFPVKNLDHGWLISDHAFRFQSL